MNKLETQKTCKTHMCRSVALPNKDYCIRCEHELFQKQASVEDFVASLALGPSEMAQRYPNYYKDVRFMREVDVYAIHKLFNLQDPSGCIHHASKKLLLSGVRTGGKSVFKDIKEARDTLTRWLELNPEPEILPEREAPSVKFTIPDPLSTPQKVANPTLLRKTFATVQDR